MLSFNIFTGAYRAEGESFAVVPWHTTRAKNWELDGHRVPIPPSHICTRIPGLPLGLVGLSALEFCEPKISILGS